MASLRNIFLAGLETTFSIFEEAVNLGTYILVTDNGFTAASSKTDSVRCIFEKFTAKDVELLTFSDIIQPKDIKGLIPFVDFVNCVVNTQGTITFGSDKYTVEGSDIDPMNVIYTLLLRKV